MGDPVDGPGQIGGGEKHRGSRTGVGNRGIHVGGARVGHSQTSFSASRDGFKGCRQDGATAILATAWSREPGGPGNGLPCALRDRACTTCRQCFGTFGDRLESDAAASYSA